MKKLYLGGKRRTSNKNAKSSRTSWIFWGKRWLLIGNRYKKINELGSAYKNVEEHINNPVKYDNFGKGLLNHSQSYMFTIEELINADKEKNTNFADILINYISLNDYDKKIAFDLVQKLSERDDEKE